MASEHKRSGWRWVARALLAIPLLYVLSYAPVLHWCYARSSGRAITLRHIPFYGPVESLVDNKETYPPLKWWADMWPTARMKMDAGKAMREQERKEARKRNP